VCCLVPDDLHSLLLFGDITLLKAKVSPGLTRSKIPRLGRRHTMYKQQCGGAGGLVNKISQCLASHGPLNTSIMIVVILSTKLTYL